jgi:hypothetical protein
MALQGWRRTRRQLALFEKTHRTPRWTALPDENREAVLQLLAQMMLDHKSTVGPRGTSADDRDGGREDA